MDHHHTRRSLLLGSGAVLFGSAVPIRLGAAMPPSWAAGPELPFAVQETYPTLHNGRIHLAGGFIARSGQITGATDQHLALVPGTKAWLPQTPLPKPLHHPNLCGFAGDLVALGGFAAAGPRAGWVMQTAVWRWNGNEWLSGPALPQPNGESVTATLGDTLHVVGGRTPTGAHNRQWTDHGDVADHYRLANLAGSWERAAPLPTARNSAAGAVINGRWHVVGGRTVGGGNSPAHEVYDPAEDRWTGAAPMPQGQGGLAAAASNGALYAFGGEFFENEGGVHAEGWRYDPMADRWTATEPMPTPRHGLGAVAAAGVIYVIGGAEAVGGNRTSAQVDLFRPSPGAAG